MSGDRRTSEDIWNQPLDIGHISRTLLAAHAQNLWDEATPVVIFHDLQRMKSRIETLQEQFPLNTLHAIAIKSNPLVPVLNRAVLTGAGLEAASIEEVWLALAAGCPAEKIMFDSPVKSSSEISEALRCGVWINADNERELERIDSALHEHPYYTGKVGLRVNPMVGVGRIKTTSVGTHSSKFGISVEKMDLLLKFYKTYRWLRGIHVHVGSQGCPLEHLVSAVKCVFNLKEAIYRLVQSEQIEFIDIGGGLPARYLLSETPPTPVDYIAALRKEVPDLFSFRGTIITEFGRAVQASCGWAVSRIEYVKKVGEKKIAVLHVGADLFMRSVYQPESWPLRFSVLDATGRPKTTPTEKVQLVGPLCFAGDVLSEVIKLPTVLEGDFVVIHDIGAYTLSMWSHHCNRAIPKVIGLLDDKKMKLSIIKKRQEKADLVRMWSAP